MRLGFCRFGFPEKVSRLRESDGTGFWKTTASGAGVVLKAALSPEEWERVKAEGPETAKEPQ